MTNDIKKYSARDVVLESYQEGYQIAAEIQKDPAAVADLVSEAERKLRNLKRSGAKSEARATLEKRILVKEKKKDKNNKVHELIKSAVKGNKINKAIKGKADIAALLMFVNAKTSTAAGIRKTKNNRAESLKYTLINAIRTNPQSSPDLANKVEQAIDQMTPYQLQQFVTAYDQVLKAEDFDSHEQMKTIAADAVNRLIKIKNQSISNIIQTLTNKHEISKTDREIYEAQMHGLNLSNERYEVVAQKIREEREK